MKKGIAILGSTGSIGTQALQVIAGYPGKFSVEVLTANNNVGLLEQQARKFLPNVVVIGNEKHYKWLSEKLADLPIKVYTGKNTYLIQTGSKCNKAIARNPTVSRL
jgi:1-deoxy-D-xylulose-5-phosphate reductoisomerase